MANCETSRGRGQSACQRVGTGQADDETYVAGRVLRSTKSGVARASAGKREAGEGASRRTTLPCERFARGQYAAESDQRKKRTHRRVVLADEELHRRRIQGQH